MDAIPLVLDGYLNAAPVPGDSDGTACWRLSCSAATDHMVEEALIPCTTTEPEIVHALFTERQPGDLLRVSGHLTLPDTADGIVQLHADALEVLWEAPLLQPDEDTATAAAAAADRNQAIHALAEALAALAGQASPGPEHSIRIHLSPTETRGLDAEYQHTFTITPVQAQRLTDAIDTLTCDRDSERPDEDELDPQTIADLTDLFDGIDLMDLTRTVLNATRPENRPQVTHAMDDMFGDGPVPDED
ncbi:hypothetical protein ACFWXK_25220 [Streptomyces sp. NPDC059070]|uniref:hypothetical protein n=1 Tax=Streptomyces sp. NPDC059070 TaxID=3346713 RepID=UPI0036CFD539